ARLVDTELTTEVGADLAVTDCVEGAQIERIASGQATHFVDEAGGEHAVDAGLDAGGELVARRVQAGPQGPVARRRVADSVGLLMGGNGDARQRVHLERAHEAPEVAG